MKLRTVAILILMACVVVATSAFGTYQDSIGNDDAVAVTKARAAKKAAAAAATAVPTKDVVGASGAGTSYKQSNTHLDISEKADGPYVKDGTNTYRGKAGGYDLRDTYDSDDERADGGGDSDSDDDAEGSPKSEFQQKLKYITRMFKEIFSKWKSQETIMAPTSIEEDPDNPLGPEGFKIREKFKKGARQGMRKLKNAFRGRFSS
jgi:hypothetical protein